MYSKKPFQDRKISPEEVCAERRIHCSMIDSDDESMDGNLVFEIAHGMIALDCKAAIPIEGDHGEVTVRVGFGYGDSKTEVGEWKTEWTSKTTKAQKEAIVFTIPLGILKIIVIANIPDEGQTAPVYVKYKFFDKPREHREYSGRDDSLPKYSTSPSPARI